MKNTIKNASVIDLFCWVWGLSFWLHKAWFNIKAGIDFDNTCSFAYTENINSDFIHEDISNIKGDDLLKKYWNNNDCRILVWCAPCQPFSNAANTLKEKDEVKWNLLKQFERLIKETNPSIISMENVPNLIKKEIFHNFVDFLKKEWFFVSYKIVFCPDYGIPQNRRRLVLLASKLWEIEIMPPTHNKDHYMTVADAIKSMEKIDSDQSYLKDPLHKSIKLSDKNLKRIRASKPGWTWRDWNKDLQLECHKKESWKTYSSVYGRMKWDEPSPTITTQFYNYWTGRFGHPEQDRALSLREGAILQTFPEDYKFYEDSDSISILTIGRHIWNAVPVDLWKVIWISIKNHLWRKFKNNF